MRDLFNLAPREKEEEAFPMMNQISYGDDTVLWFCNRLACNFYELWTPSELQKNHLTGRVALVEKNGEAFFVCPKCGGRFNSIKRRSGSHEDE